jgi:hypothetical protein
MTTDDNLDLYVGARYLGYEVKDGPDQDVVYDIHEIQFLDIRTDQGVFQLANHNEHNGYYGGFDLAVSVSSH